MRVLVAVVASLLLGGVLACAALPPPATSQETEEVGPPPDRVVHLLAERFLFTPSEITVEARTTVEIRLTSADTDHGFRVVGRDDIDVVIPKRGRGEATVRFRADEPGEYRFECSQICGAGHSYMSGTIRVTAPGSVSTGDTR